MLPTQWRRGGSSTSSTPPPKLPSSDYLPKRVKAILMDYIETRDKTILSKIFKMIREKPQHEASMLTFAVHKCCDLCKLRTCENLLKQTTMRKEIVNSKRGRHGYTPLCRSAFAGDEPMVRFLVSCGADIGITNFHGENLETILSIGKETEIKKNPKDEIFIADRYNSCLNYIVKYKMFLEQKKKRNTSRDY